jgi:hypothetical protein
MRVAAQPVRKKEKRRITNMFRFILLRPTAILTGR